VPAGEPWPRLPAGLALALLAMVAAYLPVLRGGLLWDDLGHITKPEVRSFGGLHSI
jgi:hypothetical protein